MEEKATEETGAETLQKVSTIDQYAVLFLTFFLLSFGWVFPVAFPKENVNVRIPGYIWLSSAAFHVIGAAIWINVVIFAFQYKELRSLAYKSLVYLGLCLISFISLFIWFCLDW